MPACCGPPAGAQACAAVPGSCPLVASVRPPMQAQGYIDAGLVEYQHLTSFAHPSGKPQLYAYDE